MKRMLRFLRGVFFGALAFGMVVSLPMDVSAAARLAFDYRWQVCPNTLPFRCDIPEKSAVQSAMNTWNAVKDFSGKSMLTLQMTTSSSASNTISYYSGSRFDTAVGYTDEATYTSNGKKYVSSMKIYLCTYNGKQYSVGAKVNCFDIQTIVTHELGHALCVMHCHKQGASSCFSSTCTSNVMNPDAHRNFTRRTLTSYDKSSYQVIYD